jgi:glycosyltransferase involved in cell wall biosynthesis
MKILQLCQKPPVPAVDGGCIGMNAATQGLLRAGHQVKVLAIATPKHPFEKEKISENYIRQTQFETVFVNINLNPFKAAYAMLMRKSYHVQRFISDNFDRKLIQILQETPFDIVQLESIFVAPYISTIRRYSKAKIVLRVPNVEHRIWGRFLLQQKNILKKMILNRMVTDLKNYELSVFEQIDAFLPVSEPDYFFFHEQFPTLPGMVISVGIDMDKYKAIEEVLPLPNPTLFYIGSMNWKPNLEGLDWFIQDVFPKIVQKFPDIVFTIAGRGMPKKWMKMNTSNLKIVGEVADANKFINSHQIMIVPLLSGSGIRIKILEGMALKKTIITTPIGAEGLNVENGLNIFIANTPQEFVNAIESCVSCPDRYKHIGENAREYIQLHHDEKNLTKQTIELYQKIMTTVQDRQNR